MITYNMYFDMASIVIDVLMLLVFLLGKPFRSLTTKFYFYLCVAILLSASLDIWTAKLDVSLDASYDGLKNFLAIIHLISTNFTPILYFLFILSLSSSPHQIFKFYSIPLIVIALNAIISIATSPLTHYVFYFDENDYYQHGPGIYVLYVIAFILIIGAIIEAFRKDKQLIVQQRFAVVIYSILTMAALGVQVFFPQYLLTSLAASCCLILCYLTLNNPSFYYDRLTGAYNRDALLLTLSNRLGLSNKKFSLVAVRVVDLPLINQRFGMAIGNEALKNFGLTLLRNSPKRSVYRTSDLGFVLIIDQSKLVPTLNTLKEVFSHPTKITTSSSTTLSVPLKAKISYIPSSAYLKDNPMYDPDSFQWVISLLEHSVQIKACLEDTPFLIDTSLTEEIYAASKVREQVEKSIIEGSFENYYQPLYDYKKKKFTAMEALVRLPDGNGGLIPPSAFIPEAEENGSLIKIGEIVLRKAARFYMDNHLWEKGIEHFNVNLSQIEALQDNEAEKILSIIDEVKLPHECLVLEITERTLVSDEKKMLSLMNTLYNAGVYFALDDFGTGYSNVTALNAYHYRVVKLDLSLMPKDEDDHNSIITISSLAALVAQLGMDSLAEGVEKSFQADLLIKNGVSYAQGYLYSKPLSGDNLLQFLPSNGK